MTRNGRIKGSSFCPFSNKETINMQDNIQRKHIDQLNSHENVQLSKTLNKIRKVKFEEVKFSWHTRDRINQKKLLIEGLSSAFFFGYVFEIKLHEDGDVRFVIRFDDHKKKRATCIVYSLKTNEIVTAWSNNVYDKHETIDWNAYDKDLNIVELLRPWTV